MSSLRLIMWVCLLTVLCPIADEPLTKVIVKEGSMILRELYMGVSLSRGTPVWIPKYYSPYYWHLQQRCH